MPQGLLHSVMLGAAAFLSLAIAAETPAAKLLFEDSFNDGANHWEPTDAAAWKVETVGDNAVFAQFQKSKYEPPHRSPFNVALIKDVIVGDFTLDAKVQSTIKDYNHRDACLFFGYQDPKHFYYVHLGKKTDDHANQIFIVNDAPRTKISTKTTPGTNWDDEWHNVRIVRTVSDGKIAIYYDDMNTPIMEATDKNFAWGKVGVGSFDDTTRWDDVKLTGVAVSPKSEK
ncbi:MAG TPA: hypothetical protein VGE52_00640 [Pirellulales bacterium]